MKQAAVPTRSGFVALLGAPNAGKSTLINHLVGTKISIVTHKVQTTRSIVRGIVMRGKSQIVFVDTPGVFQPHRKLEQAMVKFAWKGARNADFIALLVDCQYGLHHRIENIFQTLSAIKIPAILLLNKIDTIERKNLLEIAYKANKLARFQETFMISALNGDGCNDFMAYLENQLPVGPWLYPEEQISDLPMRQLAAEITREKLYLRLNQELPYSCYVETESWKEKKDGSIRIDQVIYVERDSQKKIFIGSKGNTIKAISTEARKEMAHITGKAVHLFLFVKVRENWSKDPKHYHKMGLDFPD